MTPAEMPAPLTAADAAVQLQQLAQELYEARQMAKKHRNCHARLAHLYKTAKSRALINPKLDGQNKEERDARAHEWPLTAEFREHGTQVAEAMGLPGTVPETVGDLLWLRERADGLADYWSTTAYDQRKHLAGWMVVASMAKQEAEFGHIGAGAA